MATFKEAIITCVQDKYVTFQGRASRSEYWYFALFNFLAGLIAGIIDAAIFGDTGILNLIVVLGLFLPGLAVGVRRLHDIGKSGWWLLISLIPLVGIIILIVFNCQKGDAESNIYGPPPVS
ncbi:MAG: DUF805 domain-containing protein [Micavibrio aeruginosavorus]|uniref:DUF805 domain-containing protein n=1 Tax=Micavibrio aeruginosavorus TaxID=349221 RepID=A0A2W5FJD9_9BACT|nr:MAG: DUF805 domain-containing protein [Micavibrio aeruginosavorus]